MGFLSFLPRYRVDQHRLLRSTLVRDAVPLFDSLARSRVQSWTRAEAAGYVRAKVSGTVFGRCAQAENGFAQDQQDRLLTEVVEDLVSLLRTERVGRKHRWAA